jgi:hypothetical protein
MKPCWSCGVVDAPCVEPCECAKCVEPEDYAEWRRESPGAYAHWMSKNVEDEDTAVAWYERSLEEEW